METCQESLGDGIGLAAILIAFAAFYVTRRIWWPKVDRIAGPDRLDRRILAYMATHTGVRP